VVSIARLICRCSANSIFSCDRSASTADAMSGYCNLQASGLPSSEVARCTWPRLAAAAASRSNEPNFDCQSAPSSAAMRRRTNGQPIAGASFCSCASSSANSAGKASGMVASNCATFISGPFSVPSAWRNSRASAPMSLLPADENARPAATRAAAEPTPVPTFA
jgi:hypothetical protein